ncbi:rRNA methyltransferase 1, mitochondrial isoform X1 [Biomphalaria glabrata]|nr:rRNA methyltransferase 1, mitochondrial isoform X1 [Biomphalaria glabrata]
MKQKLHTFVNSITLATKNTKFIDGSSKQQLLYSTSVPSYNYGLSGQAKYKRSLGNNLPSVKGEVLFGLHPVLLALKSQKREKIHGIFIEDKFQNEGSQHKVKSEILEVASLCKVPVFIVKADVLQQLSGSRPHQGVCLDVSFLKITEWSEQKSLPRTSSLPFWLLLHNIQDPMNFGAILRTAYYLGLDNIVFPSVNSCKLSPVVSKASAGAMEVASLINIPVTSSETLFCKQWWHRQGGQVVGTGTGSNTRTADINSFHMTEPTLLILGNEGSGMGTKLENMCDIVVSIPGSNTSVDSLNVSVAAGILMHWIKSSRNNRQNFSAQDTEV